MAVPNEFLAAVLGALAGGGASLGGSVVVNRREVIRKARIRLHDDLLPELEASIDRTSPMRAVGPTIDRGDRTYAQPPPVFSEALRAVRRAAALAGRGAALFVARIESAFKQYQEARNASSGTLDEETGVYVVEGGQEVSDARSRLVSEIGAFSDWVETKIL